MNLAEFLDRVTPNGIRYAILVKPWKPKQPFLDHKPHSDTRLMAEEIQNWARITRLDIYFALASFRVALIEKNGKPRAHRTQDNVAFLKSVWLDMDIGEDKASSGKGYATREEALRHLLEFCTQYKLPRPNIFVNSGGGYHVYWTFTSSVTKVRWDALAGALRAAGMAFGLKADWGCTIDSARILRPINTFNYKDPANPRPVTLVTSTPNDTDPDVLAKALQPWMLTVLGKPSSVLAGLPTNNALSAGLYSDRTSYKVGPILQNCAVLQHIANSHGATADYGFAKDVLHLLAYCEDGPQWIGPLSDAHPGYGDGSWAADKYAESMQAKAVSAAGGKKTGPTTCQRFEMHHSAGCMSCPHRGRITSPITLGSKEDDLPWPFVRQGSYIYEQESGEDGDLTHQLVCKFDVRDVELDLYHRDGAKLYFKQVFSNARTERRELDMSAIHSSAASARVHMFASGIMLSTEVAYKRFVRLMASFAEVLQSSRASLGKAQKPFGWVNGDVVGFSIGGVTTWPDGSESQTSIIDPAIGTIYGATGSLEKWKKLASAFMPTMNPDLEILLATAFAAPLVSLLSPYSVVVNARSDDTGVGKTNVTRLALSVWGHPHDGLMNLADTPAAIAKHIGTMGNLPTFWDEVRIHNDVEAGLSFILQVGQGRERRRLTQNATFRDSGSWHALLVMTSNESMHAHIQRSGASDTAAMARVFEYTNNTQLAPQIALNKAQAELHNHYGTAGAEYARYLVTHYDEVQALCSATMERLQSRYNKSEYRFWLTAASSILSGAILASMAGLYKFNLQPLSDRLLGIMDELTRQSSQMASSKNFMLEEYLNAAGTARIVTNIMPHAKPAKNAVHVLVPPSTGKAPVFQVSRSDARMRVSAQPLHEYAYKLKVTPQEVRRYMENVYGARYFKSRLGSGTDWVSAQSMVYEIDLSPHPDLFELPDVEDANK
jgi:hypothetical protein